MLNQGSKAQRTHFSRGEKNAYSSRGGWLFLAALIVVTLGAAGPAAAQSNTSLGSGALFSNTTGTADTALGFDALFENTSGSHNTATGSGALFKSTTGSDNTAAGVNALGGNALVGTITGNFNTAAGFNALTNATTANNNTADGAGALQNNTTGNSNSATGFQALFNNTTGSNNIAVGPQAGSNLTTGDNNIDIGSPGAAGEGNTIRIGNSQTATFIAGVTAAVLPALNGVPVLISSSGQMGTLLSSARYKRDIHDMGETTNNLMKLRPVTFRYKHDPAGTPQYGLIAEEVERVYPELVTRGGDGKVESVRYQLLPAMLLNEAQKQAEQIQKLTAQIKARDAKIDALAGRLQSLERQVSASNREHLAAADLSK